MSLSNAAMTVAPNLSQVGMQVGSQDGWVRPRTLRGVLGFLRGYPWLVLPMALGSLAWGRLTRNQRIIDDRRALLKLMAKGADYYCSLFWLFRGFYWTSDPHRPASFFAIHEDQPATEPRTLKVGSLELAYGSGDFDAPELRLSWPIRLFYRLLGSLPRIQADNRPLPPIEDYRAMLRDIFGPTFVSYRPITSDPNDPETVRAYMTHDYGAPWLRREGERFVADLSHWESLEVVDPSKYERYGGRLEFDADLSEVSITWQGVRYTPAHRDWAKVRYIFTSTVLLAVVVEQHTVHVHYLNAALFGLAVRTDLTPDHPIYRLLRPFTLRTVMINEHAVHTIIGQSGLLYHGSALSWPSLETLYQHAADSYRHEPMPAYLERQGLLEADGAPAPGVAFADESLRVYGLIDRFVRDYVSLYYKDDAAVAADTTLAGFWARIVDGLPATAGVAATPTREGLVDLLAVFIWNVSFWHDYTSQTGNSLGDYRLGAVLLKREDVYGTVMPNMQEHLVTLLAHQLTTVQGPKVVDNFHHVWLDDEARAVALRFQQGLWDYRADLEQRNQGRDLVFNAFDPAVIETSVQT